MIEGADARERQTFTLGEAGWRVVRDAEFPRTVANTRAVAGRREVPAEIAVTLVMALILTGWALIAPGSWERVFEDLRALIQ